MLTRIANIPTNQDFFLFGPRATGKSTLIAQTLEEKRTKTFDLLQNDELLPLLDNPRNLTNILNALPAHISNIVIDEVQRAPLLLDVVQQFIGIKRFHFALTGSSARKLRRGQANLLGGRAVSRTLWPLTCFEIGEFAEADLQKMLWGGLPLVVTSKEENIRKDLLRTYETTYLSEEVVAEQLVRNLNPFRKFLNVAAQMNGKIINTSAIGRDLGVSHNTVATYFEILEDTLIGFFLNPYHNSLRKKLRSKPKFYLFDTGVTRALSKQLDYPLFPGTSSFGDAFEHMVILEFKSMCAYLKPDWQLSFLQTEAGNEIDLVIEKGQGEPIFIEVKSSENLSKVSLGRELQLLSDTKSKSCYVLSRDPNPQVLEKNIKALPWRLGVQEILEI
jgi:uncharacterized protein